MLIIVAKHQKTSNIRNDGNFNYPKVAKPFRLMKLIEIISVLV
jgi:hypothetical protein